MLDDHAVSQSVAELDEFAVAGGFQEFGRVRDDRFAPVAIGGTGAAIGFQIVRFDFMAGKVATDGEIVFFPDNCERCRWLREARTRECEHQGNQ